MTPSSLDRPQLLLAVLLTACALVLALAWVRDLRSPSEEQKDLLREPEFQIVPSDAVTIPPPTAYDGETCPVDCSCDSQASSSSSSSAAARSPRICKAAPHGHRHEPVTCCCPCPASTPVLLPNGTCVRECAWDEDQDPSECSALATEPWAASVAGGPTTFLTTTTDAAAPGASPGATGIRGSRVSVSPCPAEDDAYSVLVHFSLTLALTTNLVEVENKAACTSAVAASALLGMPPHYVWFATHPAYGQAWITRAFPVGCLAFPANNVMVVFLAARLRRLRANTMYAYEIGVLSESDEHRGGVMKRPPSHTFRSPPSARDEGPITILAVGDTHVKAAKSVFTGLARHVQEESASLMLFVGDATYATNTGGCYGAAFGVSDAKEACSWMCDVPHCAFADRVAWDVYRRARDWEDMVIGTGVGGRVPWMTTPGNHDNEASWFFTFRPTMNASVPNVQATQVRVPFSLVAGRPSPTSGEALMKSLVQYMREPIFYSFDHGKVHVVVIATEDNPVNAYERWDGQPLSELLTQRFESRYGVKSPQYQWLEHDLARAHVNRATVPWIMVMTHRPMYHTAGHHAMCRSGGDWYGCKFRDTYEPLLVKYGVNLYFAGHSHHYQRSHPVRGNARDDAQGVVHCIVGTGGYEVTGNHWTDTPNWMAARDGARFGYAKMVVVNGTHLKWEFWGVEGSGGGGSGAVAVVLLDEAWVENRHARGSAHFSK